MARFAEAAETYQKGLEKDSSNPGLREGLSLTQRQLASGAGKNDPFDLFKNIRGHVASNPKLAHLLSDPSFIQKVAEIEANPKTNITKYLNDPQIMQVFASLIGLAPDAMNAMNTMNANRNNDNNKNEKSGNDNQKGDKSFENDKNEKSENEKNGDKSFENDKKEKSENEKNGETEVLTEKQKAKKSAEEKKMAGNKAYKRKDFAHAVQLYSEAVSLDPDNIVYLTNRAAVRMTAGDLDTARKDCEEAIERGRKVFAPFKQIAKAFERLGDIYRKEDHLEEAIEQYNKALLESSSYGLKKKLREIEERVAEKRRREYIDPEKALEHKARGNELFQQSKWQEALEEYSESIKRNPKFYDFL